MRNHGFVVPGPSIRPEPEVKFGDNALLPEDLRKDLEARYFGQYDTKHGSWGFDQKFLDWNSTEYAMARARTGDKKSEEMARHLKEETIKWGKVVKSSGAQLD